MEFRAPWLCSQSSPPRRSVSVSIRARARAPVFLTRHDSMSESQPETRHRPRPASSETSLFPATYAGRPAPAEQASESSGLTIEASDEFNSMVVVVVPEQIHHIHTNLIIYYTTVLRFPTTALYTHLLPGNNGTRIGRRSKRGHTHIDRSKLARRRRVMAAGSRLA